MGNNLSFTQAINQNAGNSVEQVSYDLDKLVGVKGKDPKKGAPYHLFATAVIQFKGQESPQTFPIEYSVKAMNHQDASKELVALMGAVDKAVKSNNPQAVAQLESEGNLRVGRYAPYKVTGANVENVDLKNYLVQGTDNDQKSLYEISKKFAIFKAPQDGRAGHVASTRKEFADSHQVAPVQAAEEKEEVVQAQEPVVETVAQEAAAPVVQVPEAAPKKQDPAELHQMINNVALLALACVASAFTYYSYAYEA